MDVVVIPTNKPIARIDMQDSVYLNEKAKFHAIVEEIAEVHATGRPVLVARFPSKSRKLSAIC